MINLFLFLLCLVSMSIKNIEDILPKMEELSFAHKWLQWWRWWQTQTLCADHAELATKGDQATFFLVLLASIETYYVHNVIYQKHGANKWIFTSHKPFKSSCQHWYFMKNPLNHGLGVFNAGNLPMLAASHLIFFFHYIFQQIFSRPSLKAVLMVLSTDLWFMWLTIAVLYRNATNQYVCCGNQFAFVDRGI